MSAIPKDAKKQDLYDYVNELCTKKRNAISKDTQKRLDELDLDDFIYQEYSEYVISFEALVKGFVKSIEQYPEKIVDMFKNRLYNMIFFEKFIHQMNDSFSFPKSQKEHLRHLFREAEHYGKRGFLDLKTLKETDSETLTQAKRSYNEVANENNIKIKEVVNLKTELTRIIREASRGNTAWKKLEEAGLNMSDLRMKLVNEGKSQVPALITSVDINILNDVSIFDEEENK
jgi:hypothetical protein